MQHGWNSARLGEILNVSTLINTARVSLLQVSELSPGKIHHQCLYIPLPPSLPPPLTQAVLAGAIGDVKFSGWYFLTLYLTVALSVTKNVPVNGIIFIFT